MAKNNYDPNNYDQRQAEIRKAKGNPNKNVHQKKNGSNYKGYAAAKKEAEAAKAKGKVVRNQLPTWVSVTMAIIFVVLVGILVLMNTVMKESLIFGQIATIVIGVCCGILFYMRRYTKSPDSKFQDVLYIILAVMAVVMIFMGGYGLLRVLQA
ncbi:MAG: hypothetical protein E7469_09065 [Ruminococcaceae bacterium]|nr:hypothetical protein [Oscillospiraceae bacterium]